MQTPEESTLIEDSLHPGHQNSWNLLGALNRTHVIVTADELIIAFGWLAGAFTKKVLFETAQSENLGETTVLMNRQHSSQQKFFDLLGEFRAIFNFAIGVMYHDRFSFRNERNVRFDCSLLSFGIPADFLNWLGTS